MHPPAQYRGPVLKEKLRNICGGTLRVVSQGSGPALEARCSPAEWRSSPLGITESQNSRGWKGPLWVTQSNPPAEAGAPRAGCTGPRPGGAGISPEKETPQPPWAACARAPSPSEGRSSSSGWLQPRGYFSLSHSNFHLQIH